MCWHECEDCTLVFYEVLDGGDPKNKAGPDGHRDALFHLTAPYALDAGKDKVFGTERRISGVSWSADGTAFVTDRWRKSRRTRLWLVDRDPTKPLVKVPKFDRSYEDRYCSPGGFMTKWTGGRCLVQQTSTSAVVLIGVGANPNGDRPFMDLMDLDREFTTVRRWRCTPGPTADLNAPEDPAGEVGGVPVPDGKRAGIYETIVKLMDDNRCIIRRESKTQPPNYLMHFLKSGAEVAITAFQHPQPQLLGAKKELITYLRQDGVQLDAELYLPPGYSPGDKPRPCLMWAYPREFKSKKAANQIRASPYRFVRTGWSRPLPWLLRGYVVLEKFAVPIIGEGNAEPNDTYIQQLCLSAEAAVDEVVRRGVACRDKIAVGGHSYGGFMTAHLVAHTKLFRAGIARSGAYNRTLTPFGFQGKHGSSDTLLSHIFPDLSRTSALSRAPLSSRSGVCTLAASLRRCLLSRRFHAWYRRLCPCLVPTAVSHAWYRRL